MGNGLVPGWKYGTELFYQAADGNLMSVPVHVSTQSFEIGEAKALFQLPVTGARVMRSYAVSGDGQRFLDCQIRRR